MAYSTYVLRKLPIHILYTTCFASEQKKNRESERGCREKKKSEREREARENLRSIVLLTCILAVVYFK